MAGKRRERRGRARRWLIGALVALVVIVAGLAAMGWHYSNEVVVPNHSGDPYDIEVLAVAEDRIELEAREATVRPGIYGLEWPDGNAIVGPVIEGGGKDSESVTRELRRSEGVLEPGQGVRTYNYVFWGDPKTARGLDFEDVEVPTELGLMPAWRIGPEENRRWAIVVHGINSTRRAVFPLAPTLARAGLTTLAITYRNDEGAPPSPDGKLHMGLTEWRDLEAAADYALASGADELVLIGYSMGGAIVTQFIERSRLADRVIGMVLDAPALDWPATIAFGARQMGLPSLAAKPVELTIGLRIGADWDQLDALKHTDQLTLPTLLFHGDEDRTVPIETSRRFAAALPGSVTFYEVPRAGHVQSWNVNPPLHEKRVRRFLAGLG